MRRSRLVLMLVPLLLGGCKAVPGWATTEPSDTPTGTAASGPSWTMVSRGKPTPTAPLRARPSPTPSATRAAAPRPTPAPTTMPSGDCAGTAMRAGVINGLTVTERSGTASVRWFNVGGANVVAYRLTAIPQTLVSGRQPDLVWRTITPAQPCTDMSASMTGLERNAPYVMSLEVVLGHSTLDGTRSATVGRSGVFYTT